jgi:proteasome alpha subunit
MIDEPYRWMEAIANRREYIEHQLAGGSPIVALTYAQGILLFTLGRERQKLFEIYDRIGMGGIGHPGDIERLRMAAIELTSTEGFTRSTQDVSLRRLATYSLSPALKAAFEQVYGPPYLARLLFAELGRGESPDVFLRLEYDGSMRTNGSTFGKAFEHFGVLAGSNLAMERMSAYLREHLQPEAPLEEALRTALQAWSAGHIAAEVEENAEVSAEQLATHATEQLGLAALEAAVLDRASPLPVTWRALPDGDIRPIFT